MTQQDQRPSQGHRGIRFYLGTAGKIAGGIMSLVGFLQWSLPILDGVSSSAMPDMDSMKGAFMLFLLGGLTMVLSAGIAGDGRRPEQDSRVVIVNNHGNNNQLLLAIDSQVSNSLNQLRNVGKQDARKLATALERLQTAIGTDKALGEQERTEALQQVNALAEAAKGPQTEQTSQTVRTALWVLKGMFTALPDAVKFAQACKELLPEIAALLGAK
jgi:hypothetical protein